MPGIANANFLEKFSCTVISVPVLLPFGSYTGGNKVYAFSKKFAKQTCLKADEELALLRDDGGEAVHVLLQVRDLLRRLDELKGGQHN
jgi:hypothetical protein